MPPSKTNSPNVIFWENIFPFLLVKDFPTNRTNYWTENYSTAGTATLLDISDWSASLKEMFYLTKYSTRFILQLSGIKHTGKWPLSERGNPLLPQSLLFLISSNGSFLSSHRQDNRYHCLCYSSHGSLAGTRNSSMGPQWGIDLTTHRTMSKRSYHRAPPCSLMWLNAACELIHRVLAIICNLSVLQSVDLGARKAVQI